MFYRDYVKGMWKGVDRESKYGYCIRRWSW